MCKFLWHSLLICPAILTFCGLSWHATPAMSLEANAPQSIDNTQAIALQQEQENTASADPMAQLTSASELANTGAATDKTTVPIAPQQGQENTASDEPMAQVTSVSQLSDVQPTDWAFQALQSLVERYGCIVGYPDGTYRGNRALTRYEFAAGLNACLDRVNELIATGTADLVTKQDLATLQRLQEEFGAELASLRGRVDALEASTAQLEANQFSTTTRLNGLVWGNITGAFADGDIKLESTDTAPPAAFGGVVARRAARDATTGRPVVVERTDDPEITFSDLVWLTLNTSFTGRDSLVTQLAVGNGDSPVNQFTSAGLYNTYGTPFFDQTAGIQGEGNRVVLRSCFTNSQLATHFRS